MIKINALEPRLLLDGSVSEPNEELIDFKLDSVSPMGALGRLKYKEQKELVIIDERVDDFDKILNGLPPYIDTMLISKEQNVNAAIEALALEHKYSAIHVYSHADTGQLFLGSASYDQTNVTAENWSQFRDALTEDGDVLLYGCTPVLSKR